MHNPTTATDTTSLKRIAFFASDTVGLQMLQIAMDRNKVICCIALDRQDKLNLEFQRTAGNVPVFFSDELYHKDTLSRLRKINLDLVILAWWPYIIKPPLLEIPKQGFLNTHPSLIPYNRGKHYYFWNLVEQVPFGVTLHLIDERIDAGRVCFQREIETTWEDTGCSLRERARQGILNLFTDNLDAIFACDFPKMPVISDEDGSFHYGHELEDASHIDLNRSYKAKDLLNIIRGRSGFPAGGAWFTDDDNTYEVLLRIKKVSRRKSYDSNNKKRGG